MGIQQPLLTFGDVIGPKIITKYHPYRSNNRLRPNRFINAYRIGNRIDLYFKLSELYRASIKFLIQIKKNLCIDFLGNGQVSD